ncbi:hypothetical protein THF1C08_280011 [Vibrio jasicida]|uniref:Uncharacterized protein n=1 Tax=Vibrio jasicida TaxID=766224 RepID=A0AAU9QPA0_9VIBR|nr:hypothetical protein THF1C08_280011 [Vibrio jasicida]CAH1593461.1 hypothetical protein THF1A12_270011 [Vibrio jasicida]
MIAPWISTNAPELAKYSLTSGLFWLIVLVDAIGCRLIIQPHDSM